MIIRPNNIGVGTYFRISRNGKICKISEKIGNEYKIIDTTRPLDSTNGGIWELKNIILCFNRKVWKKIKKPEDVNKA